MNHETTESTLSLAGLKRRDAMRGELLGAFAAVARARIVRRRAALGAGAALVAVGAVWAGARLVIPIATPATPGSGFLAVSLVETIETPANSNAIDFAYVSAESSHLVAYVPPGASLVQIIDDSELVEALAQMNRPAGLIEIGYTVRLTRDVTDDAREDPTPGRGSNRDHPLTPGNTVPATGV